MELTINNTVDHPSLFDKYADMQTEYLVRMTGCQKDEARRFVEQKVSERYRPKQMSMIRSTSYGNTKYEEKDLWSFVNGNKHNIIVPSGSVYKPTYVCQSIFSKMVIDKLAERKKVKKMQLKAAGAGDTVLAKRCWYKQATIKINCNSLPGGFGSPYNIMYDKGGYNAITSAARCMISRAYTTCEQLLGGNFAWFSVNELINFMLSNIRNKPSDAEIEACIRHYHLSIPKEEKLMSFYTETMLMYVPNVDMTPVKNLIKTFTPMEIAFLYYYNNLRHIMWDNESVFRPYIENVLNVDNVEPDEHATRDDAFAFDDTVVAVTTVAFADKLGNYGQVDICTDHPEYIPKLVAYCRITEARLHKLDLLMDTFVNTPAEVPLATKKTMAWRNTTIVSDTDSVIFSADAWDDWYRRGDLGVDNRSYQIASLVIYWLHHAVKYALKRFSIVYGVTGDEITRLAMKNEFLISPMMTYDIKKTYVGLQKVQEGVIFKDPKPDVKGQTLRGSSLCVESLDKAEDIMVNDILKASITGKISGVDLIQKVVDFENHIRDSLIKGNMDFLKITSLKLERDYKDPDGTSVVKAWKFWQYVMSEKYGELYPPTKVHIFKVGEITEEYAKWLKSHSPDVHRKLVSYLTTYKDMPKQLIINPTENVIPEEYRPLLDIREIIWTNVQPIYSTLRQINIDLGCSDAKLLFSDMY